MRQLTTSQLEEIKKTYDNLCEAWDQMKSRLPDGQNDYIKWLKRAGVKRGSGISSINDRKKVLREILASQTSKPHWQKFVKRARRDIEILQRCVDEKLEKDFAGNLYYAYFFYTRDSNDEEPKLGRAVLNIIEHDNIKLDNIKESGLKNYRGEYTKYQNRVLIIEFLSGSGNKMRMDIHYDDPQQGWLIGSYSTFEHNHIVTGTIVLERLETSKKVEPTVMNHFNDPDNQLRRVPHEVLLFLSRRKYNYHKTSSQVFSRSDFKKIADGHRIFTKTKNRFIDVKTPKIFIAIPGASSSGSKNNDFISGLIQNLENTLNKKQKVVEIEYLPTKDNDDERRSQSALGVLRNVRYFVLILPVTEKASFSLVQLGWALAYCKQVIVCFQKGMISDRLDQLQGVDGVYFLMFNDLDAEKETLSRRIAERISINLKKAQINS